MATATYNATLHTTTLTLDATEAEALTGWLADLAERAETDGLAREVMSNILSAIDDTEEGVN